MASLTHKDVQININEAAIFKTSGERGGVAENAVRLPPGVAPQLKFASDLNAGPR